MKKILIIISIILIFVFTTAITAYYFVRTYSQDIFLLLEEIESAIKTNNWPQAQKKRIELNKKWSQAQSFFPIIIDHAEFHDLEISLSKISSIIDVQKNHLYQEEYYHITIMQILPEIAIAKKLISSISEQERLTIKNIF